MATQFHRVFGACSQKTGMTKERAEEIAARHPNKKVYRCKICGKWHFGTKRKASRKRGRL